MNIIRKILELWTSLDKCLAGTVAFVFLEVLDEPACEVLCLDFPILCICIGVARVEDVGVNTCELCRHGEVEVRDNLGRSRVDRAVEDGVNDAAGVTDGDTLAGTVPAGVHEVCLGTALLHLLHELLSILCRVKLEECLSEACGEGRSRLGNTALCTCELGCEAGEEVVLGLLRIED